MCPHFLDSNGDLPQQVIFVISLLKVSIGMMAYSSGKILQHSTVVVSQDQVSCDLSGESAILNLKAGVYYGLNEVGTRVWKLIQEPKRVSELRDVILEEYEVDPHRCAADIMALLQDLLENGLIEVRNEPIK
jgi:hypothetical protein